MNLWWSDVGTVQFSVYTKPEQRIKYVPKDICHTLSTRRAIPAGVIRRLVLLTSKNFTNNNKRIDEVNPDHAKALTTANLNPKEWPTLKEARTTLRENSEKSEEKKMKMSKFDKRKIRIVMGYTKLWGNFIRDLIKKIRREYKLPWLRVQFCYSRYANLRECFQGDLTTKLQRGLTSEEFSHRKCNCAEKCKINGNCPYGGVCGKKVITYQVTYKVCKSQYVGSTQKSLKNRMKGHFEDIKKYFRRGTHTD